MAGYLVDSKPQDTMFARFVRGSGGLAAGKTRLFGEKDESSTRRFHRAARI